METFTVEAGIEIQKKDLEFWKGILKKKVYKVVKRWAVSQNEKAVTGYDIVRGEKINFFITNYEKK